MQVRYYKSGDRSTHTTLEPSAHHCAEKYPVLAPRSSVLHTLSCFSNRLRSSLTQHLYSALLIHSRTWNSGSKWTPALKSLHTLEPRPYKSQLPLLLLHGGFAALQDQVMRRRWKERRSCIRKLTTSMPEPFARQPRPRLWDRLLLILLKLKIGAALCHGRGKEKHQLLLIHLQLREQLTRVWKWIMLTEDFHPCLSIYGATAIFASYHELYDSR